MNLRGRLCSLVVSCALLLQLGVLVSAAGSSQYTETALQLGNQTHESQKILRVSARSNGLVDYFLSIEDENAQPMQVPKMEHYKSTDGGKNWKAADMSWLATLKKKYPTGGELADAYITDDGVLYCLVSIGTDNKSIGNTVYGFTNYKIFSIKNNTLSEIPAATLGNQDNAPYSIGGFSANGDIVILMSSPWQGVTTSSVDAYDINTGTLKKHTELPQNDFGYSHYNNGHVYGLNLHEGIFHLDEFDAQTGEAIRSVAIPDTGDIQASAVCGTSDGTIFVTSISGLYRLDPGKTQFEKLLDGKSCKLGNNAWAVTAACTEDGTVYVPIRYFGKTNADPNNFKQGKLYRYSK